MRRLRILGEIVINIYRACYPSEPAIVPVLLKFDKWLRSGNTCEPVNLIKLSNRIDKYSQIKGNADDYDRIEGLAYIWLQRMKTDLTFTRIQEFLKNLPSFNNHFYFLKKFLLITVMQVIKYEYDKSINNVYYSKVLGIEVIQQQNDSGDMIEIPAEYNEMELLIIYNLLEYNLHVTDEEILEFNDIRASLEQGLVLQDNIVEESMEKYTHLEYEDIEKNLNYTINLVEAMQRRLINRSIPNANPDATREHLRFYNQLKNSSEFNFIKELKYYPGLTRTQQSKLKKCLQQYSVSEAFVTQLKETRPPKYSTAAVVPQLQKLPKQLNKLSIS